MKKVFWFFFAKKSRLLPSEHDLRNFLPADADIRQFAVGQAGKFSSRDAAFPPGAEAAGKGGENAPMGLRAQHGGLPREQQIAKLAAKFAWGQKVGSLGMDSHDTHLCFSR